MQSATEENIDDLQSEAAEIQSKAEALVDALSCAASCETPADFDANIEEAKDLLQTLREALR